MMTKILIVPDVHGRTFWEPALDYDGDIIFLGDYTDPYPNEGITNEQTYLNFLKIVEFKKQNPDRVTLLVGNHELHYYDDEYICSRFSHGYYDRYHAILTGEENRDLFQLCRLVDKYLFIHAGLLNGWYLRYAKRLAEAGATLDEQLNALFLNDKSIFYEVSYHFRGGDHKFGSPLWADIKEHLMEEQPFDNNIIQIIGHTKISGDNAYEFKNIRLLDNKRLYLLDDDAIIPYQP